MEFADILEQTIAFLQHQGRILYGALKRRFGLDDAYLEDLKIELIEAQQLARDENGRILVWVGQSAPAPLPVTEPALSPASTVPQGEFPRVDPERPLFVPWDDAVRRDFALVELDWLQFRRRWIPAPSDQRPGRRYGSVLVARRWNNCLSTPVEAR